MCRLVLPLSSDNATLAHILSMSPQRTGATGNQGSALGLAAQQLTDTSRHRVVVFMASVVAASW